MSIFHERHLCTLIRQHEEAKKYISNRIEEMEREEIFVKKLIRKRASGE